MPISLDKVVVDFEIKLKGSTVNELAVISIEVHRAIYKVATAKVIYLLPASDQDNITSKDIDKLFIPGDDIQIDLTYNPEKGKETVFKGIIVKQQMILNGINQNYIIIHCSNKAVKTTLGRKSAYHKGKDSDILKKIIGEYGLSVDIDSTSYKHDSLVQYQAIDWDFIATRAEANGLLLYTNDDKEICIKKPAISGKVSCHVAYNKNVLSFNGGIESRFQMPSVSVESWSPKTQKLVKTQAQKTQVNEIGGSNEKGNTLAKVLNVSDYKIQSASNLEKEAIKSWADASFLKSTLARLKGSITFLGDAKPELNTLIEMESFGKRYDGKALITEVSHKVEEGIWKTTIGYGLSNQWYHEKREISAPTNGGLLPAVNGLQIGKVKKIDKDEKGEFRILVDIPLIEETGDGIWARFSNYYATSNKGFFFYPEKGDEVVLGFLNDDPRSAIILGAMYSSKQATPYTPDEKNSIKAIVTKNDLKIEFNDEKKILTIETPKKNTIIFSDDDKKITLKDCNKNTIEMSSDGISIDSSGDINLKAKGNINIKADKNIAIETSMGDITSKGTNITHKANMSFSAQGSVSSEIKSTGNTTVKGLMVMIN